MMVKLGMVYILQEDIKAIYDLTVKNAKIGQLIENLMSQGKISEVTRNKKRGCMVILRNGNAIICSEPACEVVAQMENVKFQNNKDCNIPKDSDF